VDINLAYPITIEEKKARCEQEPTAELAEILGNVYSTTNQSREAVACFRKAEELLADTGVDFSMEILEATYIGFFDDQFTIEEMTEAADAVVARETSGHEEISFVGLVMTLAAEEVDDGDLAVPYIQKAVAALESVDDPDLDRRKKWLALASATHVEEDMEKAVTLKREMMPDGWEGRARNLNEFAWWCFEKGVNLEEAESLARQGVYLAEAGTEKAQLLDTVAEIVNALGDPAEAAVLIEQALEEVPDDENLVEQLERFRGLAAG
jgi:tetratricopeptide (TPR) repeat protein